VTGLSWEFNVPALALAWFAGTNALLSLLSLAAATLFRDGLHADAWRARRLLAIRLAPAVTSVTIAAIVFLPAHVWLEPLRNDERIGFVPLALAAFGMALLAISVYRCAATLRRMARLAAVGPWRELRRGRERLRDVQGLHGIALAGIFRPRILVGRRARQVLTAAELEVAVAHERAHQHARDNLSRVVMYCAPDFFGWSAQARRIERLWEGEAECLADATAAAGSPVRATRLASALVKVARLASGDPAWSPGWSTLHHPTLIETRVRLLVSGARLTPAPARCLGAAAGCGIAAVTGAWMIGIPQRMHWITEELLTLLP
jgi:hypothetical protein